MIFSGVDCMKGHKIRPEMDVISLEINLATNSTQHGRSSNFFDTTLVTLRGLL